VTTRTSQTIDGCLFPTRDRAHTTCARPAAGGFTLIELLAVVALIALIASASGNLAYGTYRKMLVEKGARGVYLAAKYARLLAVERQTHCRLMLDQDNRSFFLTMGDADMADDQSSMKPVLDACCRPTQFGDGVKFEEIKIVSSLQADLQGETLSQSIVFYPDGTADTAAVQIGDGKNHYAVYVSAATGKARLRLGQAREMPLETVDLDMENY